MYFVLAVSFRVPIGMTSAPSEHNCITNIDNQSTEIAVQAEDLLTPDILEQQQAPIGLFDSGVGGLSVYMHLKQVLPSERYVYYADTLNVPYGTRQSDEIKQLTLNAVSWLVQAGCKIIVIACNSASAHALQVAREYYPHVPIVGLVPALKPAVLQSQNKTIAVLATKATLEGALLNTVIDDYATPSGVTVIKWFDPNLVPWVESGMPTDSVTAQALKQQLHQFAQQKVDHLVLGCTHYPFFREFVLEEIAQHSLGISVIDSGSAIADRVKSVLEADNKLASAAQPDSDLHVGIVNAQSLSELELPSKDLQLNTANSRQLGFYVTNPNTDVDEMTKLVQRLIDAST